jgi:hypothetical protein
LRKLRPNGIYRPPGGLRPVFAVPAHGGYHLYDSEYGFRLPPRFEVKPDGRVESWHGEPVRWGADDLVDTGKTFNA